MKSKKIQKVIFLLCTTFIATECTTKNDQDLCKLCPPGDQIDHIFCKFPDSAPPDTKDCNSVDLTITNGKFRQTILFLHNHFRDQFAKGSWKGQKEKKLPKAANMMLLAYDIQLEKLAKRNIQNCFHRHESCRLVERFRYGQNIGYIHKPVPSQLPKDAFEIWESWLKEFNELQLEDVDDYGKRENSSAAERIAAIAWAETRTVGCAQATYQKDSSDGRYIIGLVCNYGPAGNWEGERIYRKGNPCDECPADSLCGRHMYFKNLCDLEYEVDKPYLSSTYSVINSEGDVSLLLLVLIASWYQMQLF